MLFSLLFSMVGAALALAAPVTDGDFEVKTAQNLLNLCTVPVENPR